MGNAMKHEKTISWWIRKVRHDPKYPKPWTVEPNSHPGCLVLTVLIKDCSFSGLEFRIQGAAFRNIPDILLGSLHSFRNFSKEGV